jgi:hypothetical protein
MHRDQQSVDEHKPDGAGQPGRQRCERAATAGAEPTLTGIEPANAPAALITDVTDCAARVLQHKNTLARTTANRAGLTRSASRRTRVSRQSTAGYLAAETYARLCNTANLFGKFVEFESPLVHQ